MKEMQSRVKRWGSSLGLVIPKKVAKGLSLKPDQEVRVLIEKPKCTKVKEIFGLVKFKKTTSKIMKEIDRELDIG
jgi:antitoxin component of MazEF toxin-antitoxin module